MEAFAAVLVQKYFPEHVVPRWVNIMEFHRFMQGEFEHNIERSIHHGLDYVNIYGNLAFPFTANGIDGRDMRVMKYTDTFKEKIPAALRKK